MIRHPFYQILKLYIESQSEYTVSIQSNQKTVSWQEIGIEVSKCVHSVNKITRLDHCTEKKKREIWIKTGSPILPFVSSLHSRL